MGFCKIKIKLNAFFNKKDPSHSLNKAKPNSNYINPSVVLDPVKVFWDPPKAWSLL